MGILTHWLTQTCEILSFSTNKYGEEVFTSYMTVPCRFRYADSLNKQPGKEAISAVDNLWLEPNAPVEEGTVIYVDGHYYRIENITKARRMPSTVVFLKCVLERHYDVS